MFEYSASIIDELGIFDKLFKNIGNQTKQYNPLLVSHKVGKFCSFSLAIAEDKADIIKLIIQKEIANLIACDIKFAYFLHKLNKSNVLKDCANKLLWAIVCYEKQQEKKYIIDNFPSGNYVNIDSFFIFKLSKLHEKWNNIIDIINKNVDFLVSERTIEELISFFQTENANIVEIYMTQNNVKVLVNNQESDLNFSCNKQDLQNLIFEIISLSPQKLIVIGDKTDRVKLINMLPQNLLEICEERRKIY